MPDSDFSVRERCYHGVRGAASAALNAFFKRHPDKVGTAEGTDETKIVVDAIVRIYAVLDAYEITERPQQHNEPAEVAKP